jgi:copper transport protein
MSRRAAVGGLILLGLFGPFAGRASAHALIKTSDPSDGAVLRTAPKEVLITFTEPPDPGLSHIAVVDANGANVAAGDAETVRGHPLELRVPLKPLGKGVYTVQWRVVSRADGHVTADSSSFGVGVAVPAGAGTSAPAPTAPSPAPASVAGRWALYWGLAILVSAGGLGLLVFRGELPGSRVVLPAAWGAAAVGLATTILAERSSIGVSLLTLIESPTGRRLMFESVALAATGGAVFAFLWFRQTATLAVVGATAALTMLLHAMGGHAAAESPAWFNVGVQWFHLLAVGLWIGGLVWLVLWTRAHSGEERSAGVRRFSDTVAFLLAAVAVTGVLRAIDEMGGPAAWGRAVSTAFGITLLVKLGFFGLLVALGWRNRTANVPGLSKDPGRISPLRRTVVAELVIAAAVFGTTGVLTELPPAASQAAAARAQSSPAASPVVVTGHDFATSVRVRLTVDPGSVGLNRFEARVTDFDTGKPVRASRVRLQFSLPGQPDLGTPTLDLSRTGPGTWSGRGTVLSMNGRWRVQVLVQGPQGGVEVPLSLQTKLPKERIDVSRASGQPTVFTVSLPGGASVQTYVDPGTAGKNTVHFTFFRASGKEQPITAASATAETPGGSTETLKLVRFDPGHFGANARLSPGRWTFFVGAEARDGPTYSAYFSQVIRG